MTWRKLTPAQQGIAALREDIAAAGWTPHLPDPWRTSTGWRVRGDVRPPGGPSVKLHADGWTVDEVVQRAHECWRRIYREHREQDEVA